MRVWLLKDGENLPLQPAAPRMRMRMLADTLVERGHDVTWWASTFSHQCRKLLADRDLDHEVTTRFRLRLLNAGTYRRNVSVARYLHHRRLGRRFRVASRSTTRPDVIVSAFPVIEMAYEATQYAGEYAVPIVVDVRDLWPTTYVERAPKGLRRLAEWVLNGDFQRSRDTFTAADSLVAMSHGVLRWAQWLASRRTLEHDRVFYIGHPGHETSDVDAIPPTYLPRELRRLVIAYVGAFGASYELHTICEVARRLHVAGDDRVLFVLAGDRGQFSTIKRLTSELPNVVLPGWLDSAETRRLLVHADVGLIPWNSIPDAMPNKFFEYLAAGLPVVSSASGEMAELIKRASLGWTYRAGDAGELLTIVTFLAAAPNHIAARRAASRRIFAERFLARRIYDDYAVHVETVAQRTHRIAHVEAEYAC